MCYSSWLRLCEDIAADVFVLLCPTILTSVYEQRNDRRFVFAACNSLISMVALVSVRGRSLGVSHNELEISTILLWSTMEFSAYLVAMGFFQIFIILNEYGVGLPKAPDGIPGR
ncbi:hypothetical protein BJ166DRAFT_280932 [Pestalotiopsis sp. NC0098]|nr:hypothetical protein BJ166DRAFT_280932 [Pestalotiopsis sp. NC0098]